MYIENVKVLDAYGENRKFLSREKREKMFKENPKEEKESPNAWNIRLDKISHNYTRDEVLLDLFLPRAFACKPENTDDLVLLGGLRKRLLEIQWNDQYLKIEDGDKIILEKIIKQFMAKGDKDKPMLKCPNCGTQITEGDMGGISTQMWVALQNVKDEIEEKTIGALAKEQGIKSIESEEKGKEK